VESLDKQILDFRVILFKRDIDNKIEEIDTNLNYLSFDISRIEKEYSELKQENGIGIENLDTKMNELLAKVSISKIKLMINNISE
jgi:hypothetical protein